MRVLGPTIRSRLLLLVFVATLPLLAFAGLLLVHAYQVSDDLIEDTALSTARRIAAGVDAQIARAEAIGVAFAGMSIGDTLQVEKFEATAAEVLKTAKLDGQVEVVDSQGTILAHTSRTSNLAMGRIGDLEAVHLVFATGQSLVTGVHMNNISHMQQVSIHVPLIRGGEVLYDVVVLPTARWVGEETGPNMLPDDWFTIIADRTGHVIVDNRQGPDGVDKQLPDVLAALVTRPGDGFELLHIRPDTRALIGYTHAAGTGWFIAAGVPEAIVRGPLLHSALALGAVGGAVLLISLLLAWLIGRSIVEPLGLLARQATALESNPRYDKQTWRGLDEVESVARALSEATDSLRTRTHDRETALRRAETSEQRLLLAQEIGDVGSWTVDVATGRREWSQGEFKLYGLDPAGPAPSGDAWLQRIHPGERDAVRNAEARALEAPTTYRILFRILQPNGATRWLRSAVRSEFEASAPVRLIGSTIDVTDRQDAERSLRQSATRLEGEVAEQRRELDQSEQRFRTYFEYSSDALLIVRVQDGDFVYEMINKAAERLFGVTAEQVIGQRPEDVFPPETAYAKETAYRRAVELNGGTITLQRTLSFTSGLLHIETILLAVLDPNDAQVIRIISGSRDLTERQRIEGRMQHAQRLEAVGQLTGGVAHDFNNLLTVIIGNLSLLRRRLHGDERSTRYLASVEAAAQRGAKLTASLLAFSRRQTLNVQNLDVSAQISESATLLQRALGEDIEFGLTIADDVPPANADAAQLEAALLNLVINSRDAIMDAVAVRGHRNGRLSIEVRGTTLAASDLMGNEEARPGDFVSIAITDNGVGMAQAVRNRAFEPFFTTKEIGHGTGLGLSQVFGFVRQLGGHVMLDSTPGQGTTVTIFLPAATAAVPPRAPDMPEPERLPSGATVLVVEDDTSIREITAEMLRDVGMRVLTAPNAPLALEILRSHERVDLLFSDVVMPGGATGVDLGRAALELRPSLPVLLTSGYAGPALNRYGPISEFVILAKPYTRAVLIERVGAMLSGAPVAN